MFDGIQVRRIGWKKFQNTLKAHKKLDSAVDSAYNFTGKKDDAARVAFLFEKYQELVAPLVEVERVKTKKVKNKILEF